MTAPYGTCSQCGAELTRIEGRDRSHVCQAKHTLGPWDFHTATEAPTPHVALTADDGETRLADFYFPDAEANVILCRAAPDMLDALTKCVELLEVVAPKYEALADARAAIARAKGAA